MKSKIREQNEIFITTKRREVNVKESNIELTKCNKSNLLICLIQNYTL